MCGTSRKTVGHWGRALWETGVGWEESSRAQVFHAVAQSLLETHDDGHLDEEVHHAATEMAL